jgi:hypothetical protein
MEYLQEVNLFPIVVEEEVVVVVEQEDYLIIH